MVFSSLSFISLSLLKYRRRILFLLRIAIIYNFHSVVRIFNFVNIVKFFLAFENLYQNPIELYLC